MNQHSKTTTLLALVLAAVALLSSALIHYVAVDSGASQQPWSLAALLLAGVALASATFLVRQISHERKRMQREVDARTRTLKETLRHTQLAQHTTKQSWFELDTASGKISVGEDYPAMLDYEQDQFATSLETFKASVHPDDLSTVLPLFDLINSDNPSLEVEFRRRTRHGEWRWLHAIAEALDETDGSPRHRLIGVITDISGRKHSEIMDTARMEVLHLLVQSQPLGRVLAAITGMIERAYDGSRCSIFLLDRHTLRLKLGAAPNLPGFYISTFDGMSIGEERGNCATAAANGERVIVEDMSAHPYWERDRTLAEQTGMAACWSEPILDAQGDVLGALSIYQTQSSSPDPRDLEMMQTAAQLAVLAIEKTHTDERLRLLSRVFDKADEGIIVTDANACIVDVNPKFCEITGYSREEALSQTPKLLYSGKQGDDFYQELWSHLDAEGSWRGEIWNRRKDGELYVEQLTITSIHNEQDQKTHYVGIFTDITQLKAQQRSLEMMAYHDMLTQLPNRVLLTDRFHQAIARCNRNGTLVAVCFLDLDNFKKVNDLFGHSVGDELLRQVSERILISIREDDTASRLGGDEFAILIGDIQSKQDCIEALNRIHSAISEPFYIESREIHITASTGITLYPYDKVDIDTLLRHADQAMYRVKLAGKNSFDMFNAKDDQQLIETQNKRRDIEHALRDRQFALYYQPKINMCSGEVWGVEALIRWEHPEQGTLAPVQFLPAIAGTPLDIELGNWVIDEALAQFEQWHAQGLKLEISINVSAYHLLSADFEPALAERLARYPDADPAAIQLEILETTDFGNLEAINQVIRRCQSRLGVSFALDDFGTGFSSLAHLRNLTADNIKIDRSFVTHLMVSPDDYRIVDGVIRLAEAFDREVIAEGVETEWEGRMLLLMGCENAQGFAIARPMPAADLPDWLNSFTPYEAWRAFKGMELDPRQTMIALFRLSLDHWVLQFTTALQAEPGTETVWPSADLQHSHYHAWSERCHKERLIDHERLSEADKLRVNLNSLAQTIETLYRDGTIEQARSRLPEIEAQADALRAQFAAL